MTKPIREKIHINLSIDLTQWWHWHLLQQNKSNVNKTAFFVTSKMDTTTEEIE